MNQEAVQRIANAHPTGLGIIDDGTALFQVAVLIEICVHHSGTRLNDRNTGIVTHKCNQFLSSTRNAEVNIPHSIQQFCRCLVGRWHQCHYICRNPFCLKCLMNKAYDSFVAMLSITATLQNAGITTFKTKRKNIIIVFSVILSILVVYTVIGSILVTRDLQAQALASELGIRDDYHVHTVLVIGTPAVKFRRTVPRKKAEVTYR